VVCKDGVILASEKLIPSKMLVPNTNRRVQLIDHHAGAVTSGLLPDARQLVIRAREEAQGYRKNFGEAIPSTTLAERIGGYVHLFTTYWYLRPFGAAILLACYNNEFKKPELWGIEPTGTAIKYFGYAYGKGQRSAKTEIEKLKFQDRTVDESIGLVAKIIHSLHDETKDKPFELEVGVLSSETNWKFEVVSKQRIAQAEEWAKQQIEAEEAMSDDE
jgi:20S proteasome subunit alpha 7